MVQSFPYVWKNEKFCDEEAYRFANEKCPCGPEADDYGDVRKGPRSL